MIHDEHYIQVKEAMKSFCIARGKKKATKDSNPSLLFFLLLLSTAYLALNNVPLPHIKNR